MLGCLRNKLSCTFGGSESNIVLHSGHNRDQVTIKSPTTMPFLKHNHFTVRSSFSLDIERQTSKVPLDETLLSLSSRLKLSTAGCVSRLLLQLQCHLRAPSLLQALTCGTKAVQPYSLVGVLI
ncbi:uncharacterized protein LOC126409496 isoform X2 [Nymphaea colorata]|uniref:uncharacterized protein LOC126409496 isoform X1 n=1 Tax=Nymphaea colorata TaxID=210225 RepID=UPI00214E0E9B|nr:uncharacterized protein LOC126409496 isoform X1 [Nymphaea colorata]XP_049931428.1 uncharacterized protein LOC126409496 isoform X2 [Nymphaea colorata]